MKAFCSYALVLAMTISICVCPLIAGDLVTPQSLVIEADRLFQEGFYSEAETRCQKAIEMEPDYYPAYTLLGMTYASKEGYEREAISYFSKSLSLQPKQIELYNHISTLYIRLKEHDRALSFLKKGLGQKSDNFEVNFNIGIIYLAFKHDAYAALPYFLKAMAVRSEHDKVVYLVGLTYLLTGKKEMALESVTNLRRLKNEYLAGRLEEGIRKFEVGQTLNVDEMIQVFALQQKNTAIRVGEGNR